MSTDLRAALREAIHIISHFPTTQLADEAVERFTALADAPPTVAELLPLVDATHRVEWTDVDGEECHAAAWGSPGRLAILIEWRDRESRYWTVRGPWASDLTQPARLVEVA